MQFNQIANNSIQNYNKIFSQNMEAFNITSDKNGMTAFDNILNGKMQEMSNIPQGPIINTGIQMNVGLENMGIEVQHNNPTKDVKSMSPVEKTANDFSNAFGDTLNSLNRSQLDAHNAAEVFASGGDISVHDVMIATQKANLTMQMAVQTRNRLVNAYTELNNIRI